MAAAGLLVAFIGCKPSQKPQAQPVASQAGASVTLRVAVVNDPALAASIKRLRGEWNELDGSEVMVESISTEELWNTTRDEQAADLLVFAERHLGELCQTDRLRPIRESVLRKEGLQWQDIQSLVRQRIVRYDGKVMALPLGCPVPICVTQGDALASTAGTRPAYELFARGAGYATHPSIESVLFDPETMEPRLGSPPFVRALKEMLLNRLAVESANGTLLLPGREQSLELSTEESKAWSAKPLPAVSACYNPLAQQWEPPSGGTQSVSLLGTRGRLLGVTRATKNAATAFRFAGWLANQQNAAQLATVSDNVANVRVSRSKASDPWRTGLGRDLARQFADAQADSLAATQALVVPRIHKIDRYLSAVDEVLGPVLTSSDGKPTASQEPEAAQKEAERLLGEVSKRWAEITKQIGTDLQRNAYRAHLNTSD